MGTGDDESLLVYRVPSHPMQSRQARRQPKSSGAVYLQISAPILLASKSSERAPSKPCRELYDSGHLSLSQPTWTTEYAADHFSQTGFVPRNPSHLAPTHDRTVLLPQHRSLRKRRGQGQHRLDDQAALTAAIIQT